MDIDKTAPPVQITSSISDDTYSSRSLPTISYSCDEDLTSFRSNINEDISLNLKVPSSVPNGVAKGSTQSNQEDKQFRDPSPTNNSVQTFGSKDIESSIEEAASFPEHSNKYSLRGIGDSENEVSSSSSSTEEDFSTFLSGRGLQWTEKKTSRVGPEFQATQLPDAGSYLTFQEDDFDQLEQLLLADQIWDPMRATIEGSNDYVHENCPSNRKEAALELLHQRDYNETLISKEEISKLNVLDGSDWTLSEHENFRRLMQVTRHNVNSVAKSLGKSINNCLTVYYKIINVRETRSSAKKFTGMKPIEEVNELKDIGRSMRIEKRNRQKRLSECDDSPGSTSQTRKRRKASAPSDKVKNHKASQQRATSESRSNKPETSTISDDAQNSKETTGRNQSQTELPRRKSPRRLKTTPIRFSDEQSTEMILAASSSKSDQKQVSNKGKKKPNKTKVNNPSTDDVKNSPSNRQDSEIIAVGTRRAVRAAKAQALISLTRNTEPAAQTETDHSETPARRITRTMSKAKSNAHQNKKKQIDNEAVGSTRLAKTEALKSIVKGFAQDENEKDEKDESWSSSNSEIKATFTKVHSNTDMWDYRYACLVEFKEKHGHCLVPKVYPPDRQLSYWVFRQRGHYSSKRKRKGGGNLLTKERYQKLKDLGFVFKAKHSKEQNMVDAARRQPQLDAKWNHFYEEFCEYRGKTGSCLIPKVFEENQPLSSW